MNKFFVEQLRELLRHIAYANEGQYTEVIADLENAERRLEDLEDGDSE
ncbi:MAG: hypothetical protein ACOCRO_07185 [Halanaerobiales bacterium]